MVTTAKPDLEKLRALAEGATPGPWRSAGGYVTVRDPDRSGFTMSIYHLDEMGQNGPGARFQAVPYARAEDAAFVAAARTAVPWLLDRVAELERVERELEELHSTALAAAIQTNDRVDIAEKELADERRKRENVQARLTRATVELGDRIHAQMQLPLVRTERDAAQRANARLREALTVVTEDMRRFLRWAELGAAWAATEGEIASLRADLGQAEGALSSCSLAPAAETQGAGSRRGRRLRACVERWPGCDSSLYDPRCCRFPKSCSCTVYDPESVRESDLEPSPPETP